MIHADNGARPTALNRSAIIVGRQEELAAIGAALNAARAGHGRAVFLVGESGIGKSRLVSAAAELGRTADMRLLRGRGSAIGTTVPFRSLTEALLSLVRSGDPIDLAALGPYRPILARLIPDLGPPVADHDDTSLVILAEAVLRLVGLAGRERGCLLMLEDLHNADPETLAVVEYLVDNLDGQPTMVLGTMRAQPCPALEVARSAVRRGAGLLELRRFDRTDLRRLVGSCLRTHPDNVPDGAADLLWAGSSGNPFLIEELLAGIVDSGLLVEESGTWSLTDTEDTGVPDTFVRSLVRQLDQLNVPARTAMSLAAVLGLRFPLAVMREVSGCSDRELSDLFRGEPAAQWVMPDEQTPDWYAFRHPMIMETLLTLHTPAERAELARRVADAVEAVYPGLPGEWCQACATLRLDSGAPAVAGRLFAEAARRALAQGAATSAVTLLDRAWELLAEDDAHARADVLETLMYALAEAGQVDRALSSVHILDAMGAGLDRQRRARLHTRLAWASIVAGRSADGLAQVAQARALVGHDAAAADIAPIDVVAAHLELDVLGEEQLDRAEGLARRAATVADSVPLPVVACQAWLLLGSLVRLRDADEATACLERGRAIAVRHRLPIWEVYALIRLGNDDALRDGSLDRLELARQRALRIGAVTARYQAEANLAVHTILRGDFAAAETLIDQILATTTRLKLLETTQYVLVFRAILAAHRGRQREMDRAFAEFRRRDGDEAMHRPRMHGLARAFCALLNENRDKAVEELDAAQSAEEASPTVLHLTGRYGLHLLLRTMSGDADRSAYEALSRAPAGRLRWDRQFALFARAVLSGRAGAADEATETVAEALRVGAPYEMGRHLGLRLVAEAALADGWGDPVGWLRVAEDYFHGADMPAVAGACRAMMRTAGARVTQRRHGAQEIPSALRSAGITVREYEILRLLGDRLGNREIAHRLHLSPRTVERHVYNLLAKTGRRNRVALCELASAVAM